MNDLLLPITIAPDYEVPLFDKDSKDSDSLSRTDTSSPDVRDGQSNSVHDIPMDWSLLQLYGKQAMSDTTAFNTAPLKTLPERLAIILLDERNRNGGFIQNINFQALAITLGTYRDTVAALLRAFSRQGVVELGYNRIRILDVETLEEIAG